MHRAPHRQHRRDGQQTEVKHKVQDQQGHPQEDADLGPHHIGPVAGLADLGPLRLVAAVHPGLLEFHVVNAAPLLRIDPALQVHDLLLEHHQHRHRRQKEDQVRQKAVVDDGGGEEEKVQDYHQPRQQQSPAQLLLRRVHGVLVLPIPGGKAPFGGGIEVPARPQQHHGAADDAPGRTHRQHPVQGLPHRLRHASGPSHTGEKAQHAAQQPEQQNCQQVFGQRPAVVPPHVIAHGIHPPDR